MYQNNYRNKSKNHRLPSRTRTIDIQIKPPNILLTIPSRPVKENPYAQASSYDFMAASRHAPTHTRIRQRTRAQAPTLYHSILVVLCEALWLLRSLYFFERLDGAVPTRAPYSIMYSSTLQSLYQTDVFFDTPILHAYFRAVQSSVTFLLQRYTIYIYQTLNNKQFIRI